MPKKVIFFKWLLLCLAFICLASAYIGFDYTDSYNTHLNNYLVATRNITKHHLNIQHNSYLKYQSQQSILANYHEMYNNFYLEMHPKIKSYKQLANDTKYMKMSNDTTKLNNHDSNEMGDIKYKGLIEHRQLIHEHRHSLWGNIENQLNMKKFNHRQDKLKMYVIYIFAALIAGLILLVRGVDYESSYLKKESYKLRIKREKQDSEKVRRELGDNDPE